MQTGNDSTYSPNIFNKLHFIHRCFRLRYRHARQSLNKLLSYDLAGGQVFDIGANHGIFSYFLTKAVGKKGYVHVFEPQPELAREITGMMEWLGKDNVTVNSLALSDNQNKRILHREKIGDGGATLESNQVRSDQNQEVLINTTTLDNYFSSLDIKKLNYIKCDVEGHELAVIKGGLAAIRNQKPIIQIELRTGEPSCEEIISILKDIGYSGFMCLDNKEIPLSEYKHVLEKKYGIQGHRDFFFECP